MAERLVQSRGFNGFSYADVASELGVTKASLHYHYPGKAELGEALRIFWELIQDALIPLRIFHEYLRVHLPTIDIDCDD